MKSHLLHIRSCRARYFPFLEPCQREKNRPGKWKDMSGKWGEHVKAELSGQRIGGGWGGAWLETFALDDWKKSPTRSSCEANYSSWPTDLCWVSQAGSFTCSIFSWKTTVMWMKSCSLHLVFWQWSTKTLLSGSSRLYCSVYMQTELPLSDKILFTMILPFWSICVHA